MQGRGDSLGGGSADAGVGVWREEGGQGGHGDVVKAEVGVP